MIETIIKLMGFSRNTYFNWKKEKRPIINLLEKYFTKEDLEEFLKTGKIKEFEDVRKTIGTKEYILFKQFLDFKKYMEIKEIIEKETTKWRKK